MYNDWRKAYVSLVENLYPRRNQKNFDYATEIPLITRNFYAHSNWDVPPVTDILQAFLCHV